MAVLSKSRLIAYRQCAKRLWLEVHAPELREDSAATQSTFNVGMRVGEVARSLYDPRGIGTTLDPWALGFPQALARTQELIAARRPIFEAGFGIGTASRGARAFADVLLPMRGTTAWRMVEVKSSSSVKPYHLDDTAIQFHIATGAGLQLRKLQLATVNTKWVYPGGRDYAGLFKETDVTQAAGDKQGVVKKWLVGAHRIVESPKPPVQDMGEHCSTPYACGFSAHCTAEHERRHGKVQYPVEWLPRRTTKAIKAHIAAHSPSSMREIPDDVLTADQLRVKTHTLARSRYFDSAGAASELAAHPPPALFLDFETVSFSVPIWPGTRPYEQVPFQFSLHRVHGNGQMEHAGFLDLSGDDPGVPIARALIRSCGVAEPIFAYHSSFEARCLEDLALRLPRYAGGLRAIRARLVDLEPVATRRYYHPDQCGSWSIKKVAPTVAPNLDYGALDEVQDGGAAQVAYAEAVNPATSDERRDQLRRQLWAYCRLDTFAMVGVWALFTARDGLLHAPDDCASQVLHG